MHGDALAVEDEGTDLVLVDGVRHGLADARVVKKFGFRVVEIDLDIIPIGLRLQRGLVDAV